jgi:hypothetical protein
MSAPGAKRVENNACLADLKYNQNPTFSIPHMRTGNKECLAHTAFATFAAVSRYLSTARIMGQVMGVF